ncbi:MAG: alpha/beta fold hydrolase [Halanaeroarchaeum sp.]
MPTAEHDGVSLVYDRSGPPDAPTIAFVSGLGYGRWMWNWQRERLESDYEVIVWDNRGAGDSDAPEGPYTIEEMAGDLEAVLAAADRSSVHLVGASMGGMIAQQYALEYDRATSLSLLCTTHGGEAAEPIPEETQHRMFSVPEDADEREAIRWKMAPALTDEWLAENDDVVEQIVDWRLESDASESAREAQAAGVMDFDVADRLGEIVVPTLVMHGTEDRVVPTANGEMIHESLPQSDLELFDGGHLFFVERADAVTDTLRRHVESHAST